MTDSLFGTDGIRGCVGQEPVTPQTIMKLGWATGCVFSRAGKGDKVVIGKDPRISGYLLEASLVAGFLAAGVNVALLGLMPTPGVAYLTRTVKACAGVAISASHNPYFDNGIKIFSPGGTKLDDALVARIDQKMRAPMTCVESSQIGKAEHLPDPSGRYIEYCKRTFAAESSLAGVRIVIDCANGAACEVAPRVLDELGADVIAIANQPDGFNINEQCGCTDMDGLAAKVVACEAQIGIALDGDADRVLLIDENGVKVDGDQILFLIARYRQQHGTLGGGVVGTLMSNLGLELALRQTAIPFVRTNVGDRYVHQALMQNKWLVGGEASGHIICLDKGTTGDGMVAALEVLHAMLATGKPLSGVVAGMEIYPQKMINVRVDNANAKQIVNAQSVVKAVELAEKEMGDNGRVVLRASGTEPLVRVMIEGNNAEQVAHLATHIAGVVSAEKSV